MLSAHADANELIRWARGFTSPPRRVFVVHLRTWAADTLRARLSHELGLANNGSSAEPAVRPVILLIQQDKGPMC